ncbi:Peptidase S24-like [Pseudomonas flavescens]|uniref:Peptidase S24-like n=1 Tax=Phytopseudomonas flavescens TaxID=29435 RepID=A0A1G7XQZ8_9GAMM|nr:XRE family transcriptional regulator [Pseudomonas flavescens]SDG86463.1 Peptidase S24-like [Pseudomonas flavescens]
MNFGQTIRNARKAKGWTLQQLVDELSRRGVEFDASNLSRVERGTQAMNSTPLAAAFDALGINISTTEPPNVEDGPRIRGMVPLISWVQAGCWNEVVDVYSVGDAEEWIPCPVAHGPRTYVLRVRGESMYNPHGRPSFRDGDFIFVDPDRPAINKSLIIAKLDDDQEATFKQLVIEGAKQYLKALNPSWPEPIIQIHEDASISGVVISKLEKLV